MQNRILSKHLTVQKIATPPAYGEIVELMPRLAYGMKGEENLDM